MVRLAGVCLLLLLSGRAGVSAVGGMVFAADTDPASVDGGVAAVVAVEVASVVVARLVVTAALVAAGVAAAVLASVVVATACVVAVAAGSVVVTLTTVVVVVVVDTVVVVVVIDADVVVVARAHDRSIARFESDALAVLSAWASANVMNSTGMVMTGHGSLHPIAPTSSPAAVL